MLSMSAFEAKADIPGALPNVRHGRNAHNHWGAPGVYFVLVATT